MTKDTASIGVAGHRRLWPRAVLRRFEVTAWLGATAALIGLLVTVIGPVLRARARAPEGSPGGTSAVWVAPAQPKGSAPVGGPACAFDPCARPSYSGRPTRLRIVAIGVETPLQVLDVDANDQLVPPKSYEQAGWYGKGVAPGDVGPAILAGHVDSRNGPAVFYDLHRLRSGDTVEVERGGQWIRFRVTTVERYPKDGFPTERVYRPTPDAELRLITCGGDFDRSRLTYRDNLVVYAILA